MATPVPQKDDVELWTVEQVAAWLQQVKLTDICDVFLRKGIDGHKFLQLSEEDLFKWGGTVSLRSRVHILKLSNQIKSLQQHPSATRQCIEISSNPGSRSEIDYLNCAAEYDKEKSEGYVAHEGSPTPLIPPRRQGQSSNPYSSPPKMNGWHNLKSSSLEAQYDDASTDFHSDEDESEECSKQENEALLEDSQGGYLIPRRATPSTILQAHQHGVMPMKQHPGLKETHSFGSDSDNSDWVCPPSIPEHSDKTAPHDIFGSSHIKNLPLPRIHVFPRNASIHSSSQGVSNNHFPRWHTDNGSSQTHAPPVSQDKNDHDYEPVEIPQEFWGVFESSGPNVSDQQPPVRPPVPPPRNQRKDFDDRILGSRPGAVPQSPVKRPPVPLPPVARKQSGQNVNQAQTVPDLPKRSDQSRQPKIPPSFSSNSLHSSHKSVGIESPTPQEFSSKPSEVTPQTISLGNGESIMLTQLYLKIMDKPYFQLVSRSVAKQLVLQGGEGTFLIRPSTRTKQPLTLTVKHDDRHYNINIRERPDGFFALGNEKPLEHTFSSIDEIVYTHYKEPITLDNGKCARLRYSPSKPMNSGVPDLLKDALGQ